MTILMIAPQPFFEPRGTPFSEYFRIRALSDLGHRVDLVTYPFGESPQVPGLRIIRCWRPPGIRTVKTGPSLAKLVLDFFLFWKVLGRLFAGKYDLVHSHEEGSLMGAAFQKLTKTPHLYDMHSSLAQQMENFQFTRSRLIVRFFRAVERLALRNAASVIVICRTLFDHAAAVTGPAKLTLIENFLDDRPACGDAEAAQRLRQSFAAGRRTVVLYAGTLEAYQGMPLLLDSMKFLDDSYLLVLVGGDPDQVDRLRRALPGLGLEARVVLLGRRPAAEMPDYLKAADVLVSPRSRGTNIPLKIYSYLASGVPLVATDLPTHTQTLSPQIALLAKPEPQAFAAAIVRAAGPVGKAAAARARDFCRGHYTAERYRELVAAALAKAVGAATPAG